MIIITKRITYTEMYGEKEKKQRKISFLFLFKSYDSISLRLRRDFFVINYFIFYFKKFILFSINKSISM